MKQKIQGIRIVLLALVLIAGWALFPKDSQAFGPTAHETEWLVTPASQLKEDQLCPGIDTQCKEWCEFGVGTGTFRCFTV